MSPPYRQCHSSSLLSSSVNYSFLFMIETYYKDTGAVWVLARDGEVPPNAVVGGYEPDGTTLYVGRFYTKEGQLAPRSEVNGR